ncbi:hypothetical protein Lalb_Chr02g0151611 [Lupinus albus]|uniref:Uncharacterized protein n=1 Tax=Lupinus albus TaxID=3870 RepID=A0A6A4QZZ2_LUPAL|nr:hypothetical protein Lalb_Chr02g0151611 [Lupinus albus]
MLCTGFECGNVDEKGNTKYTLCEKPKLSFFWDNLHLSQNGWYSVFTQLESSLSQINGGGGGGGGGGGSNHYEIVLF